MYIFIHVHIHIYIIYIWSILNDDAAGLLAANFNIEKGAGVVDSLHASTRESQLHFCRRVLCNQRECLPFMCELFENICMFVYCNIFVYTYTSIF